MYAQVSDDPECAQGRNGSATVSRMADFAPQTCPKPEATHTKGLVFSVVP